MRTSRAAVVLLVAALVAAACSGGGGGGEGAERPSRACTLLEQEEIESFVGEPVHEGTPDEHGEGVADTCRWGDADPAAPGRILSLTLAPAGTVEAGEGDPGDAPGSVSVTFTAAGQRVELTYDVVPVDALEADARDRLERLASRVRDRLGELR